MLLGCDPKTLRKHFEVELSVGDAKATAKVAQTLFNKAVGGDTASLIFWMKARAGWRERSIQEHTGPGGEGPMSIQVRFVDRPPLEDREQWNARRQRELGSAQALLEPPSGKAAVPAADGAGGT